MEANRVICGDALSVLQTLPSESVNCCVTSPPYFGLRDYGEAGQIGQEKTPNEYITHLTKVFREVRRVLVPDGTAWINISDCYAPRTIKAWQGIKGKDMVGIPWMLAFALRDDGWFLRSNIIWHKLNAMPHSVKDRPVNCYEHVFLLAKSQRYFFDYTALQVPMAESSIERIKRGFNRAKYTGGAPGQGAQAINQPRPPGVAPAMRRGRDIWDIGTSNYRSGHFATYPVELARRCIAAGCPDNSIVLDPFFGAGTTGVAAMMLGRQYVGIEISPDSCDIAQNRIAEESKNVSSIYAQ